MCVCVLLLRRSLGGACRYYAADTVMGLVLFLVLFLLSIVQLVDSLQALLLFSSDLLLESQKGAQLRLFDAKRGALGVQHTPDAPGASTVGLTVGVSEAGRPSSVQGAAVSGHGRVPPGRSPLGRADMSVAAQARLAGMDVNDYSTVTAQRMQGDSQPLVSSVWDPERARRRAASRGLRTAEGSGSGRGTRPGGSQPGSGTFVPP